MVIDASRAASNASSNESAADASRGGDNGQAGARGPLLAWLTTHYTVGMIANMKAELLQRDKIVCDDGAILEMLIWRVPEPVRGSAHAYKYRLFYGLPGKRLVCYDNERSKGDHRHVGEEETPYVFTDVETLVRDFLAD